MEKFYKKMKGVVEPRPLLKKSFDWLSGLEKGSVAYDLGCGVGQDTFSLVEKGFSVKAVDISPDAFKYMEEQFGKSDKVETIVSSIEDLEMEPCDFITSSFALPFIQRERFDESLLKILGSLKKEGLFAGNFFGPNDDWGDTLSVKTFEEVEAFFENFEILFKREYEERKESASGEVKNWHIIEVIARKKN